VNQVLGALRTMGIIIGIAFLGLMLWTVVIGPSILLLLHPRS